VGAALLALTACPRSQATAVSLVINPDHPRLPAGQSLQYAATAQFSDGTTRVVTNDVAWSVDDAWVATVDPTGAVVALKSGDTVVRARLGDASASRSLTVVPGTIDHLEVSPGAPAVPVGLSLQLQALAITTDGETLDVTRDCLFTVASGGAAVSMSEQTVGLVSGLAVGQASVKVAYQGVTLDFSVAVSDAHVSALVISPYSPGLPLHTQRQLSAIAVLSDGSSLDVTPQVTWRSEAPAIVSFPGGEMLDGVVQGEGVGTALVSARLTGALATTPVTVTNTALVRLEVNPAQASLARGTQLALTALGVFDDGSRLDLTQSATWSSVDQTLATVDRHGVVTGVDQGAALVRATVGTISAQASLTITAATLASLAVTPTQPTVARGTVAALRAIGTFSDGTTQDLTSQVLWASSAPSVALVSNAPGQQGLITGVTPGTASVSARGGTVQGAAKVTVTQAALSSLQVSPPSPTLAQGSSLTLSATALFTDGSQQDVTQQATWLSASPSTASVSTVGLRGRLTGNAEGETTLTVNYQGLSTQQAVIVTRAELTGLSITPVPLQLPQGAQVQLTATGVYSDNSTQDLTDQVVWSVSAAQVASVSNAVATVGQLTALAPGVAKVRATLGALHVDAALTVTPARLLTLDVTPAGATVPAGLTQALTATGHYSDGTTQELTAQVTWSVSSLALATVSNAAGSQGLLTAVAPGDVTVTASLAGISGAAQLTVGAQTLLSITVAPQALTLARGTTAQLTARGTFSTGLTQDLTAQVTWSSSNAALLDVANATGVEGLATALGQGTVTVTARLSGQQAQVQVVVSAATLTGLEISPLGATAPVGVSLPFVATGRYTDGSTQDLTAQATWSCGSPDIASISNAAGSEGRAYALSLGVTTVQAIFGGQVARTSLTVTQAVLASIQVSPASVRIANLTWARFSAVGVWTDGSTQDLTSQVTWAASDASLASLSNVAPSKGRATALAPGSVTVTATRAGVTGSASLVITSATLSQLQLTPPAPSAAAGLTLPLKAQGLFSDGTSQELTDFVSWSSAAPAVASVSSASGSEGLVSAQTSGTAVISATALGVTNQVTFTVNAALLVSLGVTPASATVPAGLTQAFVATGTFTDGTTADVTAQASWATGDMAVAQVSNAAGARGRTTGLSPGTTTVTASLSGQRASASVTVTVAQLVSIDVTPATTTLPQGRTAALTATGTYTDGSTRDLTRAVTWASSDPAVAAVSNASGTAGVAQALTVGSVTVTATQGGSSGQAALTVSPALLISLGVSPVAPSIPSGLTQALSATGLYTDGTTQDLTEACAWSSTAPASASVSTSAGTRGRVSALVPGSATVTCAASGLSASAQVTVTPAALTVLQVTPSAPAVAAGLTQQLVATGVYSDGTTQNLTGSVTWSSSAQAVASVSNASGSRGLVSALATGSATISATQAGVTGSTTVIVTPALLAALQVTPASTSRPKGLTQAFVATGVFTDGSTADLSTQVTWASSDPAKAAVSNAAGSQGLASALGVGSVSVLASLSGITGSTPFTVTPAQLVSVAFTQSALSAPLGTVRTLVLKGLYTDGSLQSLTAQGSYVSLSPAVVSVSNAAGSKGLATMIAGGTAQVHGSYGGFTASITVTVTQAQLASIDVSPGNGSTALGYSRQFIAIGTYTDHTTQVLTDAATWSSSDENVAIISNATGSNGLLSTVAPGALTVTASWNGVTGTTSHTVTAAALVGLEVSPASVSVAASHTAQLVATGTFSDGSTQDVTTQVTWVSDTPAVAQVSNAAGSEGLLTGISSGTATVTASFGANAFDVAVTVP
jgi:hypothetical protein